MADLGTTVTTPDSPATTVIQVTPRAIEELKTAMAQEELPEGAGLRIGVKGGGCSGFSYVMGFDGAPTEFDLVEEHGGVRVFIDKKSVLYLQNTTLEYVESLQQKGFVFQNPNATGTCGCGQSFSAKRDPVPAVPG